MKLKRSTFIMDILLTLLIIVMSVFLFAIAKGYHPTVAGYQILRVLSGSMSPVLEENDLIIVRQVPEEELEVGDIITFLSDDPYLKGIYNTHRIYRIDAGEDTGQKSYVTKGDVNETEDLYPVSYDQIAGKYIRTLPYSNSFGKLLSSMAGSKAFFFVIMLPLMLCLLSYLWQIFFILVFDKGDEYEGEPEADQTQVMDPEAQGQEKTPERRQT